jgi:hypothetical protein
MMNGEMRQKFGVISMKFLGTKILRNLVVELGECRFLRDK